MGIFSSSKNKQARQQLQMLYSAAGSDAKVEALLQQQPDSLSIIVEHLTSSSSDVQQQAAKVLEKFARDAPMCALQIVQSPGAVAGLVAQLQGGTSAVQREAAVTLGQLAAHCADSRMRIGQAPGALTGLVDLLRCSDAAAQHEAAYALSTLALKTPANQDRIVEADALPLLAQRLSSEVADVQFAAAFALSSLAEGSQAISDRIGRDSAALRRLARLLGSSGQVVTAAALALQNLAQGSPANRQRITNAPGAVSGLTALLDSEDTCHQRLAAETLEHLYMTDQPDGSPEDMATAALAALTTGGSPGAAPTQDAPPPPHSAQDAGAARDQTNKPPSRPHNKLATTVELLGMLDSYAKHVPVLGPILGPFIKPLTGFLDRVEQVRVNKAKARSMKSRVEALMRFLACIFSSEDMWQRALTAGEQTLLKEQLTQLDDALVKANGLVNKWIKPMPLGVAVRFLKGNLDKDDIKEVENSINKAIQGLNAAVATLNLIHTLAVQQQLQQLISEAKDSKGLEEKLEQANRQDLQELQGHLEQLLGGQAELQKQLAAATQEQRQAWDKVSGDIGGLAVQVKELTDAVRAWMEERGGQQSSSSSSSSRSPVSTKWWLSRERVKWDANALLDQGGFANVYVGKLDGGDVVIKLLRMAAFRSEEQREQMLREAAVLSRLHHRCIVRFWGVVPVEESRPQPAVARGGFFNFAHDSAGSHGGRGWAGPSSSSNTTSSSSSSSKRLSLGLVMEKCDMSLQDVLDGEALKGRLLPLPSALYIAERIACGLKYLHTDAPLKVVHGDLKPANVLLKNATHEVLLTDFGLSTTIAVHTMSTAARGLVGAGGPSGGTLAWAAPEQLQAWATNKPAPRTFASDMYAFGLILYQLLVGKASYEGMGFDSEEQLKGAVRGGERPKWDGWEVARGKEAGTGVLGRLKGVVEACWAHSATERPTAQHVHAQLSELLCGVEAAAAVTA